MHQVLRRLPGSSLTEFPSLGVVWFVARVVSILCQCLLLHWQEGRACRFHLSAVMTNEAQKELKNVFLLSSFQIYCALVNALSLLFPVALQSFLFEGVHRSVDLIHSRV